MPSLTLPLAPLPEKLRQSLEQFLGHWQAGRRQAYAGISEGHPDTAILADLLAGPLPDRTLAESALLSAHRLRQPSGRYRNLVQGQIALPAPAWLADETRFRLDLAPVADAPRVDLPLLPTIRLYADKRHLWADIRLSWPGHPLAWVQNVRIDVPKRWADWLLAYFAPVVSQGRVLSRPCLATLTWDRGSLAIEVTVPRSSRKGKPAPVAVPDGHGWWEVSLPKAAAAAVLVLGPTLPAAAASYTVQPGDTLYAISRQHYGTNSAWSTIYRANRGHLRSPHRIYPGMVLQLPETTTTTAIKPSSGLQVRPGDTLFSLAEQHLGNGAKWTALWQANRHKLRSPNLIYAGMKLTVPGQTDHSTLARVTPPPAVPGLTEIHPGEAGPAAKPAPAKPPIAKAPAKPAPKAPVAKAPAKPAPKAPVAKAPAKPTAAKPVTPIPQAVKPISQAVQPTAPQVVKPVQAVTPPTPPQPASAGKPADGPTFVPIGERAVPVGTDGPAVWPPVAEPAPIVPGAAARPVVPAEPTALPPSTPTTGESTIPEPPTVPGDEPQPDTLAKTEPPAPAAEPDKAAPVVLPPSSAPGLVSRPETAPAAPGPATPAEQPTLSEIDDTPAFTPIKPEPAPVLTQQPAPAKTIQPAPVTQGPAKAPAAPVTSQVPTQAAKTPAQPAQTAKAPARPAIRPLPPKPVAKTVTPPPAKLPPTVAPPSQEGPHTEMPSLTDPVIAKTPTAKPLEPAVTQTPTATPLVPAKPIERSPAAPEIPPEADQPTAAAGQPSAPTPGAAPENESATVETPDNGPAAEPITVAKLPSGTLPARPLHTPSLQDRPFRTQAQVFYNPVSYAESLETQDLFAQGSITKAMGAEGSWRLADPVELAANYLYSDYRLDRDGTEQAVRSEHHGRLMGYYVLPIMPNLEVAAGLGTQISAYGTANSQLTNGRQADLFDTSYQRVMLATEAKVGYNPIQGVPLTLTAGAGFMPWGKTFQASPVLPDTMWGFNWTAGARYAISGIAVEARYRGQQILGDKYQQGSDMLQLGLGYEFR